MLAGRLHRKKFTLEEFLHGMIDSSNLVSKKPMASEENLPAHLSTDAGLSEAVPNHTMIDQNF